MSNNKETFSGLIQIQENMTRLLEPSLKLQRQFENFLPKIPKYIADFQSALDRTVKVVGPHVLAIAKLASNCKKLEAAGFLPHYTIPFDEIQKERDVADLSEFLEQFYKDNWATIKSDILWRVEQYEVDEEAKDTFREAIQAHEQGLYRCACRVIFPEIERVSRIELHAGSFKPITSQHELQKLAGELGASEVEPGGLYTLEFYGKLTEHLYHHLNTPQDIANAEQDSVPNRHAAVHGIVSYSSFKNSLNALFMADYILQVVTVTKKNAKEATQEKEGG